MKRRNAHAAAFSVEGPVEIVEIVALKSLRCDDFDAMISV
jgi:hypothetical protein